MRGEEEVWTAVEGREDIVETMRLDAVEGMPDALKDTYVNELNVKNIEDSDDDTTRRPPALRVALVALLFDGEGGGGVRQWRFYVLSTEGQDAVHQSACLYASAPGRHDAIL